MRLPWFLNLSKDGATALQPCAWGCRAVVPRQPFIINTKTPASKGAAWHQRAIRCLVLNFCLFQFLRPQWERKCGTIPIGGDSTAFLIAFRGY